MHTNWYLFASNQVSQLALQSLIDCELMDDNFVLICLLNEL